MANSSPFDGTYTGSASFPGGGTHTETDHVTGLSAESTGTASGTVLSGGIAVVNAGGIDFNTQIVGGEQDVFGYANGATAFFGSVLVESGGSAIDFTILSGGLLVVSSGGYADPGTLSGGTEVISAGGSDDGTQISGGTQFVYGTATNATIFLGSQVVESGGIASGTVISGGLLTVEPGGSAIGATVYSGGTAELIGSNTVELIPLSGATIEMGAGAVTVGLGGTSSAVLAGVTISGLQAGDAIDLTDIPFSAGAAAFFSGSELVVSVGVNRYELGLDPSTDLTGDQLRVANDGTGHAEINIAATPQNIAFAPTAANAYLSEVTPFLTSNGASLHLNLLLLWNVGNGSADAPFQILQYDPNTHSFFDDTSAMFSGQVPSLANPRNVTIANFNGNGPGFIIAEQGLDASPWLGATDTLLLSNQFGQLVDASANLPQTPAYTHDVSSGVIDPSGDIGVFFNNIFSFPKTAPYYLIGNGDGTFVNESSTFLPAVLHTISPAYTASAMVDVNGDGLADLLIGPEDQMQGTARLYLNPGNGDFSSVTPIALPSSPLPAGHDLFSSTLHGASVLDIQPIHLSNPNYADLVVISTTGNYEGYAIQILINDGSGHFTDQTASRLAGAPSSQVYTGTNFLQWIVRSFVVDLNGDGASDIVVQGNNGPSEVFLNDGSGHFDLAYSVTNPAIMAVATIEGTPTLIENDGTLVPFAPPPVVTDPIPDQTWLAGQTVSLTMPADAFADPGGQDLTYTAGGSNGAALPNWLSFDSDTGEFSGTVPFGAKPFAVTITATDSSGWFAEDSFNVLPLTVVSGGQTIIVSSGQTSAGLDLLSGGVAKVLSGGTTINTIISSGGTEIVIGGRDFSATVNSGGLLKVISGGSATGASIGNGGHAVVSGGGRDIGAALSSGGQIVVSAGGTDISGTVNSGAQLSVLSGGKASGTTVIGLEVVSAGGLVVSATVENNGTLGGSGSGLAVFGIASRTLVGTDGQEGVFSGGTDIRGTVLAGGREFILSGGIGISATLAGNDADPATFAAEIVTSGGRVSRTVVSSGGVLVVSAGGLAVSTTVNSTGIGFNRGALALSGGTASSTTINSGGQEGIFAGGTNIGATVSSGGGLFVHSGLASRTTLSGGLEVVFAGGQTVSTTVTSTGVAGSNGGLANLGGIDIATVINNNAHAGVFSGGTDIGAIVNNGGVLYVHSGGTAANTTVKSGGLEVLETGGVTTGITVISSGGALELNGALPSSVTYKPGAILEVGPAAVLQGGPLPTGVATAIILPGATLSGGTASSGNLVEIFGLSSNGVDRGGKVIVFSGGIDLNDTLSKGSIETLSAGAFASATTISSGGAEIVSRGGLAVGAAIMSGGKITIASGGTDIGLSVSPGGSAIVSSGGILELLSGNTTSGITLLAGATLEVASGAVLSGQTVSKGVTVVVLSGGTAESLSVKAGGVEIISAGGFESGSNISSGGTFETIGNAGVTPHLLSGAVLEVGSGALTSVTNEIGVTVKVLSGGLVSGGTAVLRNVVTALNGGIVSNLSVSSGGGVVVSSGGIASGSTILSGGTELIASGGTDLGVTSVGSGGLLETLIGGTAILSGTVANSGTLFASGARSLIDIVGGATVTGGGIAKIANGILNIEGSGDNQNVVFQSAGTGTLEISDALGNTSAFGGTVSGFGQNVHQFINLTSVHFVSGVVSARYSSSTANSGVLTVTSGGSANVVAVIDFSGHYVTSNFRITSGSSGTVEIFDPPVGVQQTTFGSHQTLGYIEKIAETAIGDILAGKFALLCNYMASEFANTIGGHAGTLPTEPQQMEQLPVLTYPHAR